MRKNWELLCELKAGEPGTEEMVAQFGDALLYVRRWYDPDTETEITTAEVVEAARAWHSLRRRSDSGSPRKPR